jgi:hypothetical protein
MTHSTLHLIRHYVEMVVAMLLGMVVLGPPAEAALRALGSSSGDLRTDAPAVALLGMAAMMTAPMVGWMRYRGHGPLPCAEMAASMVIPTLAVIALMWGRRRRGLRGADARRARRDAPVHARRDAAASRRVHLPRPPRGGGVGRATSRGRQGGPREAPGGTPVGAGVPRGRSVRRRAPRTSPRRLLHRRCGGGYRELDRVAPDAGTSFTCSSRSPRRCTPATPSTRSA